MNISEKIKYILVCIVALLMLSSCTSNPSDSDTTSTTSTGFNDSIVVEEYNEDTADRSTGDGVACLSKNQNPMGKPLPMGKQN